jgi:hypothetical protein
MRVYSEPIGSGSFRFLCKSWQSVQASHHLALVGIVHVAKAGSEVVVLIAYLYQLCWMILSPVPFLPTELKLTPAQRTDGQSCEPLNDE